MEPVIFSCQICKCRLNLIGNIENLQDPSSSSRMLDDSFIVLSDDKRQGTTGKPHVNPRGPLNFVFLLSHAAMPPVPTQAPREWRNHLWCWGQHRQCVSPKAINLNQALLPHSRPMKAEGPGLPWASTQNSRPCPDCLRWHPWRPKSIILSA